MFPDQGLKAMIWLGKLISLRTGREKAGQGTDGWTNDDRTKDVVPHTLLAKDTSYNGTEDGQSHNT